MYFDTLRGVIAETGTNQGDLAKSVGMAPNSLSRKLHGCTDFKVTELVAICEQLNIRISDLKIEG